MRLVASNAQPQREKGERKENNLKIERLFHIWWRVLETGMADSAFLIQQAMKTILYRLLGRANSL